MTSIDELKKLTRNSPIVVQLSQSGMEEAKFGREYPDDHWFSAQFQRIELIRFRELTSEYCVSYTIYCGDGVVRWRCKYNNYVDEGFRTIRICPSAVLMTKALAG